MIALAPSRYSSAPRPARGKPEWPARFLVLLPMIRRTARFAFHEMPRNEREEAIQEIVASAFVAYARLVERGKEDIAYATPLARYAVAQYRAGRRVGSQLNVNEPASSYCQQQKDVVLESLFRLTDNGRWEELVVEDKRSTPADIATTRIDFKAWLRWLDRPKRTAAKLLAGGATTMDAAKQLKLSQGRVSQLRQELKAAWEEFQGEVLEPAAA